MIQLVLSMSTQLVDIYILNAEKLMDRFFPTAARISFVW